MRGRRSHKTKGRPTGRPFLIPIRNTHSLKYEVRSTKKTEESPFCYPFCTLYLSLLAGQVLGEDGLGDVEVDHDTGDINERRHEGARCHGRVGADSLEEQWQHRADQRPPQADTGHRQSDD